MRWEWLHPQQGTQLGAQGWLLCSTATSGALGTGPGHGHTLLSLCLAVTVPHALPWDTEGSFGPWPQLQVSPGWLCWVTPPGEVTGASAAAPAFPSEGVALGDIPGPELS